MIITLDVQMCWNLKAGEAVMGMMRTVRKTGRTIMPTMVMGIMTLTGMEEEEDRLRIRVSLEGMWF